MDRAGYGFLAVFGVATIGLAVLKAAVLTWIFLLITLFIAFFFRDPNRRIPDKKGAVISPADGRVIAIEPVSNSPLFDGKLMKISVFMSVFNVHVNRIPTDGEVKQIRYYPGRFHAAHRDKASSGNEKNAIWVETLDKKRYCVIQVAGLIARRIICRTREGEQMTRGQRFGIICFGSRVDTYLPHDVQVTVSVGDRTRAGVTVLGYLS